MEKTMINDLDLYMPEGWFNAAAIMEDPDADYHIITGGRGIGKTYGFIDYCITHNIKFVLMRRTETEASVQTDPELSSLVPVLSDRGLWDSEDHSIVFKKRAKGKISFCYIDDVEVCCVVALSTIASLRGIDLDRYEVLLYDEFIPEPHVRNLPAEGLALKNAVETIGRNRELKGRKPLRVVLLGNSFNIANPVFIYDDLVSPAEQLLNSGEEIYRRGNKCLILCQHSPIQDLKAETSLYKDVNAEFKDIALGNKFHLNDFTLIRRRNIKEFKIHCKVGDIYIYKHKSEGVYYVSFTPGATKENYNNTTADLLRFRRKQHRLYIKYLDGKVLFEKYECLALFQQYYKV